MKTTIGRLKSLLRETIELHEPELSAKIAAMSSDDVADDDYVDADTGEIVLEKGKKARTSRAHAQYGIDSNERAAKRQAERDAEWAALDAEDAALDVAKPDPEAEYRLAVERFAANWVGWSDEGADIEPADAAHDAALGFFYDNPQWRTWARALGMSKAEMHTAVAEFVYEAVLNRG